jgi:hypothetical protein
MNPGLEREMGLPLFLTRALPSRYGPRESRRALYRVVKVMQQEGS